MTLNNIAPPIRPTDADAVLELLARQAKTAERNVCDPRQWIRVGSGAPAPDFQNGFSNVGGTRVPLRYRFLRPYDPVTTQRAVEIQGSVTGGGPGLTIFTLLEPLWQPDGTAAWQTFPLDFDLHLPASDDSGDFVVFTVTQAGDVVFGFV